MTAPRLCRGGYDYQQNPYLPLWPLAPTSCRFRLIKRHVAGHVRNYTGGTRSLGILICIAGSLLPLLACFVSAVRRMPIRMGMELANHFPTRWWCRRERVDTATIAGRP